MAFGFKFWHIPEHRVFHYEPRYYDERKERLEEIYMKYGKCQERRAGRGDRQAVHSRHAHPGIVPQDL